MSMLLKLLARAGGLPSEAYPMASEMMMRSGEKINLSFEKTLKKSQI